MMGSSAESVGEQDDQKEIRKSCNGNPLDLNEEGCETILCRASAAKNGARRRGSTKRNRRRVGTKSATKCGVERTGAATVAQLFGHEKLKRLIAVRVQLRSVVQARQVNNIDRPQYSGGQWPLHRDGSSQSHWYRMQGNRAVRIARGLGHSRWLSRRLAGGPRTRPLETNRGYAHITCEGGWQ